MTFSTASTLLDAAILGQTLFGASYIGISLFFHLRSRRQQAAACSTAIAWLTDETTPYNWEAAAVCLATTAVAFYVVANAPEAAAQPLLPAAAPMADIAWTFDDDLDVTAEAIAAFDATVATATETDEYLATVAPITCVGIDTALWLSKDAKIVEIRKMCQLLKVKGAARINKANGVAALAQICEDWGCM